ncbi:hypothetical protein WN943_001056 [Citrus x changshan-huyou]
MGARSVKYVTLSRVKTHDSHGRVGAEIESLNLEAACL